MTPIPVKYAPGTNKARQHTKITSPAFDETDHVRFQSDGRLATLPPYALSSITEIVGRCRSEYAQRITGSNERDCYFFGTHSHLYVYVNSILHNITPLKTTGGTTLANDPLEITNTDRTVVVNHTAHGFADGYRIGMSGIAGALNGVPAADFNREHIITYISANEYSIEVDTAPTSTDLTAGGAAVLILGQITAGNAIQESAAGMSAGDFGGGLFSAGGTSTTGQIELPRIWSFDPYGNDVVMCPGDYATGDGQKIYIWDGDTDVAPTVISGAPTDCNWVMVVNNSVVALCGRTVKIAGLGTTPPTFSGLTYRAKSLERVDRAHSGWRHGDKEAVIHYGNGAILLKYVGGADIWDLSDLYEDDGVISPMSCIRIGTALVWRGRRGFYGYDGGVVQPIENTQNGEWILANENTAKAWHSFASADQKNGEVYFHFVTGNDSEPGDYVLFSPKQNSFTLGRMNRTASQRPGFLNDTFYMSYSDGSTTEVYRHFTQGATTFDWYARTSFFFLENGGRRFFIDEFRPDSNQSGNITLQIIGRDTLNGPDLDLGTYTITSSTSILNVRASAVYMSLRFSGSSEATLGIWAYNVRTMGKR